jgi:hypothetical protein
MMTKEQNNCTETVSLRNVDGIEELASGPASLQMICTISHYLETYLGSSCDVLLHIHGKMGPGSDLLHNFH